METPTITAPSFWNSSTSDENCRASDVQPAEALWRGALAGLTRLYLERNAIGDGGMRAFASAVARRALPQLHTLRLHENDIGDSGLTALSEAMLVNPHALEKLGELYLANNPVSAAAVAALKDVLRRRPGAVATDL